MQRLLLKVTDQKKETKGDATFFTVRGNGILFRETVEGPVTPKHLQQLNENFKNCLRYVKHFGGWPAKEDQATLKLMMSNMKSKWSSTELGIAIRPADDPLKEFAPFVL